MTGFERLHSGFQGLQKRFEALWSAFKGLQMGFQGLQSGFQGGLNFDRGSLLRREKSPIYALYVDPSNYFLQLLYRYTYYIAIVHDKVQNLPTVEWQ